MSISTYSTMAQVQPPLHYQYNKRSLPKLVYVIILFNNAYHKHVGKAIYIYISACY